MEEIRQYLLRIIAAALICGIVQSLPQESAAAALTRLVCGVIMTVVVLSPLRELRIPELSASVSGISQQAEEAAQKGERISADALAQRIQQEARTYILNEAEQLGLQIDAQIILSNEDIPIPEAAVIQGDIPARLQGALEEILDTKLGIAKENVTWIS